MAGAISLNIFNVLSPCFVRITLLYLSLYSGYMIIPILVKFNNLLYTKPEPNAVLCPVIGLPFIITSSSGLDFILVI